MMPASLYTPRSGLIAVVVFGVLVAACSPTAVISPSPVATPSPAATPSPSPTAAPTPSPTAAPTPSPSVAPSAAPSTGAAADPALGLKVAAPYALTTLDPQLENTFRAQFAQAAGPFGSLLGIGGRGVSKAGALAGFLFVIEFPPGVMTDANYQAMLQGLQSSSAGKLEIKTIEGTAVSVGTSATGGIGAFREGDHVLIVITPAVGEVTPIASALLSAN